MFEQKSVVAVCIAAVTLLSSCALGPLSTDNQTTGSGGMISAETLSAATFTSIDEAGTVEEVLSFSNPAPSDIMGAPQIPVPVATSPQGLGKKTLSGSFTIDTIGKELRITTKTETALFTKHDTVFVLSNDKASDSISDNEDVTHLCGSTEYRNGSKEYYTVSDNDGDGIITSGKEMPRARLTHTTFSAHDAANTEKSFSTVAIFEASAGIDTVFGTESDNLLHKVTWVRLDTDGDTVAAAAFTDADGDGIIGSEVPGETDIALTDYLNPLKPLTTSENVFLRNKRTADGKEQIIRFTAEEVRKSGRINKVWVTTESGDTLISKDGLVVVHLSSISPAANDSEATAHITFTLDPGFSIGDPEDNKLHKLSLNRTYRFGIYKAFDFSCEFSPAVPHGQKPECGTFQMDILYKNGKSASLDGSFSRTTISAVYTGPDADTSSVEITDNR